MSQQPEKFEATSASITDEQKAKLKSLFPGIVTESGKVDFDRLKLTLGETVDAGKERYGMNWPGKADCFKTIQRPSMATLVPVRDESVNFDTTENLIIEGDNLETLKLLQKSYLGKVKMIYIDPPYNTGNDFIYPDNFSETLDTYLRYTGQVDNEGRKFSTNTETDGRYHSKWMNMMYPRLFLAYNLLRSDGVIFISIDDHEVDNLKKLCNEVFGEENFIACVANVNNPKGRSDDKYVATAHEYLLIYKKAAPILGGWQPEENVTRRYNKTETDGSAYREMDLRKTGDADRREDRPNMFYYFLYNDQTKEFRVTREDNVPKGFVQIKPLREDGSDGRWRWGFETATDSLGSLIPKFMPVRKIWGVFEKDFLEADERIKPTSAWTMKEVNSERGSEQFIELGFDKEDFPRPKPIGLLRRILEIGTTKDDGNIILDFFAGSGVTGQAVLEANQQDGGNRKYLLVQLPEHTDREEFTTIAEITKERIRRVIKKLNESHSNQLELAQNKRQDRGFKVFKLQSSNFKAWNTEQPKDDAELVKQLTLHVDHLVAGRTQEDVLYELLLKSGFPLNTKVEKISLAGKDVFSIADGAMLICLEKELTPEVIKAMADTKPERVVCLDAGFAKNDQLKTNAVQTMKAKGVTKFQTV